MILNILKRKPAYSQEEIAEQIGQVSKCMQLREKAHAPEAVTRADTAVECAQEILNYMLGEIVEHGKPRR